MLDRDLVDVEGRLRACAAAWELQIGSALGGGHRAAVFECLTARGEDAVVKLTPTPAEATLEGHALDAWAESGATVRLLDADYDAGVLLLRRVRPATHLPPGDEATALRAVSGLIPRLHAASTDAAFPTLAEMFPFLVQHSVDDLDYERRMRNEPDRAAAAVELLPSAAAAAARLCETNEVSVLLHGDLIDKNLLLDGDRYLAADPIPRLGDPASEVGFFAHEHRPASGILTRARAIAAATGNDEERSQRWAAIWTVCVCVSAWRDDQHLLDDLITSGEFADLLAG